MSNGTLDTDNEPYDHEGYDSGFDAGLTWVTDYAGQREKENLLGVLRGEQQLPDFESCGSDDDAIHEFVRRIHPPCGLHRDSAVAYWDLNDEMDFTCFRVYLAGFVAGALNNIMTVISDEAERDAVAWLELRMWPRQREHVERFVDQHGDTWREQRPEGCASVHDVVRRMMGSRILFVYPEYIFSMSSLRRRLSSRTEEYATYFIDATVRHIRRRNTETPDPPRIDPPRIDPPRIDPPRIDPPHIDPPRIDPPRNDPNQRQPRNIRLGRRRPTAEGTEGTPPPAEDEQT